MFIFFISIGWWSSGNWQCRGSLGYIYMEPVGRHCGEVGEGERREGGKGACSFKG